MTRLILLFALLTMTACGGGSDGSAASHADVASDTPTPQPDTSPGEDASSVDITLGECVPGSVACVDDTSWVSCDASGELGDAVACEAGTTCVEGHCRVPLCTPLETRCISWTRHRTCEASGLHWGEATSCGVDEICHEGQCLTCFPGEPTCATMIATAVCGEDGRSFPVDDITSCQGEGEHCHEPSGVCLVSTCTAGQTVCAGAMGYHDCLASGTLFSPEITPCQTGQLCTNATCSKPICSPQPVLFVVDRTGALADDWAAYRAGIKAATAAHPDALYGFMPFPMAFGCPGPGPGDLPRFAVGADADIDVWFDTVKKSAGEAALQHILQTVLDRAHELFGGNGGRVVLISSGSADCGSDADAIGAVVAALRLDHGVRTFVIGHRASLGLYPELDAAHAEGGSGWDDWEETSYDLDVAKALVAALEDVPSCQ